jgi:transcriptional regulator with XRE-family HTH domain
MTIQDKQIGEKVRALREAALLSQSEIARQMRDRGTKWAQATVWSVESGERPLRLTEAGMLAEICNADPASFFGGAKSMRSDATIGVSMSIKALTELLEKLK